MSLTREVRYRLLQTYRRPDHGDFDSSEEYVRSKSLIRDLGGRLANSSRSVWYDILHQRLGRSRRLYSTIIATHGHDSRLCRYRHDFADDFWKVSTKTDSELQNSRVLTSRTATRTDRIEARWKR
jgi:hypothetical protein